MVITMDNFEAFAKGEANRGKDLKIFDWIKCATFIQEQKDLIDCVTAGLAEDWGYTSGVIYDKNGIVNNDETYTYLASTWGTPTFLVNYNNGQTEEVSCYLMEGETKYNEKTYWPKEARNVLKGGDNID